MPQETDCSVCNDGIEVNRHTPKKLQEGVIYHFCSEDCRERFVQDPSEFTSRRRRRSLP